MTPLVHGVEGTRAPRLAGQLLEDVLATLRARPVAGSPLAALGEERLRLRDAGAELARAALLAEHGAADEADSVARATLAALPQEISAALASRTGPSQAR
jgi:hypothetical protein